MIRYTKKSEEPKEKWILSNGKETEEELAQKNIMFVSVLELSMPMSEGIDQDAVKYKGPMYFDIDCEGHLEVSICSAIKIINKLINYGIPEHYMKIYCSGGKGFHILVPQDFFVDSRFKDGLPRIYKRIAYHFQEEGLDFNVYSQGKGRMWRVANVLRRNGMMKVRISFEELKELTPEKYLEYAKNPKPNPEFPKFDKGLKADALIGLYRESRKMVARDDKRIANQVGVTQEDLKALGDVYPACVLQMSAFSGMNKDKHFNDFAMQFMSYCSASGKSMKELDEIINDFAENSTSHRHNTKEKRKKEIRSLVTYSLSSPNRYKFNCGIMRSVFEEDPCTGCPIQGLCEIQEEEQEFGITIEPDGYYRGESKISTFTLRPCNLYKISGSAFAEHGSVDARHHSLITAVEAEIIEKGTVSRVIRVAEESFNSKSAMIQCIQGLGTPVFYGTDSDVQKIKHKLFNDVDETIGEIMEVFTSGITPAKPGSDRLVYTEPGFSIDQYLVMDTHDVVGTIAYPPMLANVRLPARNDETAMVLLKETVEKLLLVNDVNTVGAILGWMIICHFKTHLMTGEGGRKQFPLLSLYGNAGSGKTETAILFNFLHGVDHAAGESPVTVSEITPYALLDLVSSTTTTPRILDEYNKSKMSARNSYTKVGEILKMAWGSQVVRKGTVNAKGPSAKQGRTGASTVAYPVTSPLVVCSEQQPMAPALQQRMVMVHMKLDNMLGKRSIFDWLHKNKRSIFVLGKMMMLFALKTKRQHLHRVVDSYEDVMPEELEARPKWALQLTVSGLDLFNEALMEFGIDVSDQLTKVRNTFIDHLDSIAYELNLEKSRTEVDLMLDSLSEMAALQEQTAGAWLNPDRDYLRIKNKLYLDTIVCLPLYTRYCRSQGTKPIIDHRSSFLKLIDQEKYCISPSTVCIEYNEFANGRKCVLLDLSKLKEKGIEVEVFRETKTL